MTKKTKNQNKKQINSDDQRAFLNAIKKVHPNLSRQSFAPASTLSWLANTPGALPTGDPLVLTLVKKNLAGLNVSNLEVPSLTTLRDCILLRADFSSAILTKVVLRLSNLEEANFMLSQIKNSDLALTQLVKTNFSFGLIQSCNFKHLISSEVSFMRTTIGFSMLVDSIWEQANFDGAALTSCGCYHAIFIGCSFKGAKIVNTTFKGSEMDEASLKSLVFETEFLENVELPDGTIVNPTENRITEARPMKHYRFWPRS